MRAARSHAAMTVSGSPSRSAPTSSVTAPAPASAPAPAPPARSSDGPRSGSRASATSATRSPGSSLSVADARELDAEDRAHARAHGLRPVRVGAAGAERDARGAERLRGAQHRADVAGVADAVQVHAQRPRGGAPALLVDGEHARAGAERGHARERGALDVVEVRRRRGPSRRGGSPRAPGARRARRRRSGPRLRPGTCRCARARAWCAGGARPSGGGCVGMRSGSCRCPVRRWRLVFAAAWCCLLRCPPAQQKGRRPFQERRPGGCLSVCRVPGWAGVRQPTPRGRPRQNVGTCRRRARRCRRAPCGRARCRRATGRA